MYPSYMEAAHPIGNCSRDLACSAYSSQSDSIMANHGFTIADLVDTKGVILNIPPMKVGEQLSDTELVTTRRIAALRIHIERAIGRIKN